MKCLYNLKTFSLASCSLYYSYCVLLPSICSVNLTKSFFVDCIVRIFVYTILIAIYTTPDLFPSKTYECT